MVKEVEDHQPVVIFTKENTDTYKPVPVVNIPSVRFIGGPSKQGSIENVQGYWDLDRSAEVITAVDVPVDWVLSDIGMNSRRAVVRLECDGDEEWINSLE